MSPLADYQHPRRVRKTLRSLVPVVCPPRATELGLADDIVDHVELTMRSSPTALRAALVTGILGYEAGAAAMPRHLGKTASTLSEEQAATYFSSWWRSPLPPQREFAKGIKGLLCLACFELPAMMRELHYTPQEWIEDRRRHRLQTFTAEIAEREESLLAPDPLPSLDSLR